MASLVFFLLSYLMEISILKTQKMYLIAYANGMTLRMTTISITALGVIKKCDTQHILLSVIYAGCRN